MKTIRLLTVTLLAAAGLAAPAASSAQVSYERILGARSAQASREMVS